MADGYTRPYLDAQSWITALSGAGPFVDDLRQVLSAADRAELSIVMSVLMPLEVLGGRRGARTSASIDAAAQALRRSSIVRVAVNDRVVERARELRIDPGLKTVDALHLASAAAGRADAFLTNDDQLIDVESYRGMPVVRPVWAGDVPLPGMET